MGHGNSGEQDARVAQRGCAAPRRGEIERERDGAAGSRALPARGAGSGLPSRQSLRVVGDHTHGAADHQPAGRAEKSSNDGVGDEADGAAGARDAEPAQQKAGQGRRKPKTIITGASRSSGAPSAHEPLESAPTSDAVTAAVAPSGPAMAKGRELRAATKAALIVVVRKVAAMP